MAYCKKKGACGRSHVLFAGVELTRPVYEQVCVFSSRAEEFNFVPKQRQPQPVFSGATPTEQQEVVQQEPLQQEVLQQEPLQQEPLQQEVTQHVFQEVSTRAYPDFSRMTNDQMMEMHNPTCAKCGRRSLDHKNDVDQNGWRIAYKERIRNPPGLPVYNPSTGNWSVENEGTCTVA
jgi:hypothetical protein